LRLAKSFFPNTKNRTNSQTNDQSIAQGLPAIFFIPLVDVVAGTEKDSITADGFACGSTGAYGGNTGSSGMGVELETGSSRARG
jgi:hypothetical protein